MDRWYYNQQTSTCQPFTYAGLHGNQNNFLNRQVPLFLLGKHLLSYRIVKICAVPTPASREDHSPVLTVAPRRAPLLPTSTHAPSTTGVTLDQTCPRLSVVLVPLPISATCPCQREREMPTWIDSTSTRPRGRAGRSSTMASREIRTTSSLFALAS